MFGHEKCEENFLDLHTLLEAQMILENLQDKQADSVARQITELLSSLAVNASNKVRNSGVDAISLKDYTSTKKCTRPAIHSGFPQRLKHAMKVAGLTQKELAERAGVSQSVISRLITGKDKTGTRSGVLSHALGVNFDWLHYGTGEMYPANFSADNREV